MEIFPRFLFDCRPYIQPLQEATDDIEIRVKYGQSKTVMHIKNPKTK